MDKFDRIQQLHRLLRSYRLRVEHVGANPKDDPLRDPLIL